MIDLSSPDLYTNGIPHDVFRELRAANPVAWCPKGGSGFWAVTRYHDAVKVLRTPSARTRSLPGDEGGAAAVVATVSGPGDLLVAEMAAAHARSRRR